MGGLEIQMKLRDHLAKKFNDLKKSKNDVTKVPRAMGKLFKEAARVKTVLSANQQIYAQVRKKHIVPSALEIIFFFSIHRLRTSWRTSTSRSRSPATSSWR